MTRDIYFALLLGIFGCLLLIMEILSGHSFIFLISICPVLAKPWNVSVILSFFMGGIVNF